jgi:hypothetical protein
VLAALAAALVLVVGAGCAGVPDSGDPVAVPNKKLKQGFPSGLDVNAALVPPRPGGGPLDTITLLLDAARSTQSRDQLGEMFLTDKAQEAWKRSSTDVLIYRLTASTVTKQSETAATVRLTGSVVGSVTEAGVYQPQSRPLNLTVNLVHDKVWRIDSTLPGALVRESEFGSAFRAVTLYFAALDDGAGQAAGGEVLIPEQRFMDGSVPQETLATPIVRRLLQGPSPWLAPVTRNPLPKNTGLRSNVTFQDFDVVVDLSPDVESAKPADLNAFAAEVAWSLRPYFSGNLRLQVNGRPLIASGVDAVQGSEQWMRYNPTAEPVGSLYYTSKGALRRFAEGGDVGPDPQLGGRVAQSGVVSAALSTDGVGLALVKQASGGRQTLWIGGAEGGLRPTISGRTISRPSWGHGRDAVFVAVDGMLYQVDQEARALQVAFPQHRSFGPIRAIRLSLDGARIALIAGDGPAARAYVGLLQPPTDGPVPVLRDLRPVLGPIGRMQDIGWSGPTVVMVGGQGADGTALVHEMSVDGAMTTESPRTGLRTAALAIAATPSSGAVPFVASAGLLYQGGLRTWSPLPDIVDVRAPFYPG